MMNDSIKILINIFEVLFGLSYVCFCIYFRPKGFLKGLPKIYFVMAIFIGLGMIVAGLIGINTILSVVYP